jgi:hypothetical protein
MMSLRNPPKSIGSSFFFRKAQDGGSAASLVAIIGLLIVFYLLFVPPSFRDEILEGNSTGSSSTAAGVTGNATILRASPGTLSPLSSEEVEHNIPSITLYSKVKSEVLGTQPTAYAKTSVFGKTPSQMYFEIADIESTDNVLLSFVSEKRKGTLVIMLNGNEVFNGELTKANPDPISLNKRFLVQGNNKLEFIAESVGIAFWRVNKHQLSNAQVTASIKDASQQESRNVFVASATEKANMKTAVLRFSPDCIRGRTGKLNVLINTHSIFYAIPDCGGRVAIEFSPDVIREGENTITFVSEEGSYLIDLVRITSEMKEVIQPAYYFEVTADDMTNVRDGKFSVFLAMTFTDDKEQKAGTMNINGRETEIFQYERNYEKNINDYIIEGNNAVKIVPETTLQIVSLEVVKR